MQQYIPADSRGTTDIDWLYSKHSFSFGNYYDPNNMGFGALRVINDDIVTAGNGFSTHSHNNMEIITIVLDGLLAHKDSTGTAATLRPGDVQAMSAGSGISHSEYNGSETHDASFLQIWIEPATYNEVPQYKDATIPLLPNTWNTLVGMHGSAAPLTINQSAVLARGQFEANMSTIITAPTGLRTYLFVISGTIQVGDITLTDRDALATDMQELHLMVETPADILLIHIPA